MVSSEFISKIEFACKKKESLYSQSKFKYAIRSMFAGAFLTFSTAAGAVGADLINKIAPGSGRFLFPFVFAWGLASASPKGTYSDLASLKQAKPSGDTGTYITTNNKNWNYWNGSDWVPGGVYQASAVSPYDTFDFISGELFPCAIFFNNH